MARIRSVHPGLFTDEAFVSLSDAAQIFFIGLWTEADDQGVFDWKPTTLRMRLRGAKDGSVEPLLSELEAANCICMYEIDGRKLGAIRNFRKHQKPKTPNATHPTTVTIRNWVGLTTVISETDPPSASPISEMDNDKPPPFPPKGEKSSLMEGRMEDGGEDGGESARASARTTRSPWPSGKQVPENWLTTAAGELQRLGLPKVDLAAAAAKFSNYNTANPQPRTPNEWQARFQNWVLDEVKNHERKQRNRDANGQPRSLAAAIFSE